MGLLRPIINFKDKIMQALLTSDEVVRLIDDDEFKTAPAIGLKYKKVYPYAFVPPTVDEASSIVCFEANIADVKTDAICNVELYIWVLCHCSVVPTAEGARHDVLADAIDDLLNHSRDFGIGMVTPIDQDPVTYSLPNYDYVCRKLSYLVTDFNYRGAK